MNVPITESLEGLVAKVRGSREHLVLTKDGDPEAVVMSTHEYDSIMESLEIISDPETMRDLSDATEDVRAGRTLAWADVKRKHGLA